MTIIYNKNAPGQYIVTGLEEKEKHESVLGYRSRRTIGDFTVISSSQKTAIDPEPYGKIAKLMKKFLFMVAIMPIIPFAVAPVTGYISFLFKMK